MTVALVFCNTNTNNNNNNNNNNNIQTFDNTVPMARSVTSDRPSKF